MPQLARKSPAPASAAPSLKIHAFGRLRIFRTPGKSAEIGPGAWPRRKSRTLFAYLLCARPRRVHKEELVELLWPDSDPSRSVHVLQVALSDLRAALGNGCRDAGQPFVRRVGEYYSLDVGAAGEVDVEVFAAECEAGRKAQLGRERERAVEHLERAVALYAGDFLGEERFAEWAERPRARLRDQYVDALQRLIRLHDAEGRLEQAAVHSKTLLTVDPYLEPIYRDLMRYQHALGDRGGVVQTFVRCEQAMREGFDSQVAPETRGLAEQCLGAALDSIVQRHLAIARRIL